ncbi:phage portal protein family protein [Chondromyces crocatus]|uniref:Phage portal protein n=1 Tax=Chondromyces crocatus TaxID=52 RepID=A0A0K1EC58_CHOCO|nr:DUF935 family protein [Chondromyces crocatus]AKT38262.1 uncharacterized protein CMC5_024050 [Chondromyces crocatus]
MSLRAAVTALLGLQAAEAQGEALRRAQSAAQPLRDEEEDEKGFWSRWSRRPPPPTTVTRWYLADLEKGIHEADTGDLSRAAQLCKALLRDGVLRGVLSTRTGGLVRLPRRFSGEPAIVSGLAGREGRRGVFERMFPAAELALLAADGILLGIGVGELLPVEGCPFPVLRRLDPEWLRYRWDEDCWSYQSVTGPQRITPGDGRWILHCPGGESQPWLQGLWPSLGRAYIAKEHALLYRDNYSAKLANAARAAVAPLGATEQQRRGFIERLIAWGLNTVFELPVGWDVKLIESNGRGFEVFKDTIQTANEESIIAIAGQLVTTSGGVGFANADIHKSIRADLIQGDGEGLAHTLNTQGLPPYVNEHHGADALDAGVAVEWDTSPPQDLKAEAEAISAAAKAIEDANRALLPYGKRVDERQVAVRFGIPIAGDIDGDAQPDIEPEPLQEAA